MAEDEEIENPDWKPPSPYPDKNDLDGMIYDGPSLSSEIRVDIYKLWEKVK